VFRVVAQILVVIAMVASAHGQGLVRVGESWRYYKAYDVRSLLKGSWQSIEFDDSRWQAAPSGYIFDDPRMKPRLRAGIHPGYGYIRKKFVIADVEKIKALVLRVEFERGFVAHLNGVEVARLPKKGAGRPMFGGEIERGFPTSSEGQFDLSQFISLLKNGENVMALEGPFTSEAYSAFPITPCLLANFIRGPFIQNATTNSVQVIWRTLFAGRGSVEFGTETNMEKQVNVPAVLMDHVVPLTNLALGQKYFYRVKNETPNGPITSSTETFTTLKAAGAIQFAVFGDTGQGTSAQTKIADVIQRANPDFVLHCGDLVYQGFNDRSVDWRLFNYYQSHMARVPYYMVPGNHDLNCCVGDGQPDYNPTNWLENATNFQNSFFLPTNTATGTEHFYSFDAGDAHFIGLYNPWFADYNFTPMSEQFRWFTNDLAHSSKRWKFIFMHMPLATSGGHVGRDDNANSKNDSAELMHLLLPVAERYGVNLIFGGHDHNFERFAPTNGIHHLVTGGGGGTVYDMKQRHPASAQFWAIHHCLKVSVAGETATIDALDSDGIVFDSFVIHRGAASDQVYQSTWHTPRIETGSANDGDGNITGQKFDFAGAPIFSRAGRSSNLGRVYVNNDAANLYVGLQGVILYGDSTVMLFVESPRQPGVTNLAGLGNGRIDARAQGADGLDFLESLSFTTFAPSIGCILGDEFADRQSRDFRRGDARFNTGQGIYRLDHAFSDLRGAHFQQYNRSPQVGLAIGESSADFIELAIPLASVGELKAGDIVKMAAIVSSGDVNMASQTRAIDTSLFGTSLSVGDQGRVILSPIKVRLSARPEK
jgi:hypothetical protein